MSNTLADFADDDVAGRFPVVQEIKALTKEIAATYKAEEEVTPAKRNVGNYQPNNVIEALNMLHNVRSNITKWGKKLKAAKTPDEQRRCQLKLDGFEQQRIKLQSYIDESTRSTSAA